MRKLLGVAMAALLLAFAAPASAQRKESKENSTTRTVQGVVTDSADNPLEGAVVQLKDSKTLHIRSFITKPDGAYHFHGLSKDIDYELKADHQGKSSASKTLSSFDSRRQAVMNLKIEK
jgi:Carboxypeptidase regulatory-like domain